jgi:hypothetical protein
VVQIHSPRPFFSTIYITRGRHENPQGARSETKRSCLTSVGRRGSLFLEFITLQREVRVTDHPVFEKVRTGLGFWKKNQKARFKHWQYLDPTWSSCFLSSHENGSRSSRNQPK